MTIAHQNKLAGETSPYLQQHAKNPVNWYPWSPEALEKARRENKPILLSIGYAACHWCHVMAHESFEDDATASLMNQLFINIKVDREERPDLDKIYQTAHYLLTQRSGGWPLTIFLTPDDLTPFFSGTYFPREPRHQLPAFKEVLHALAEAYHHQSQTIKQQNAEIQRLLQTQTTSLSHEKLNDAPIQSAIQQLQRTYDKIYGGFGNAPKFPQASKIELLLEIISPAVKAGKEMGLETLKHMAEGGLYDQLQGGFYRYSVDAKWQIPHFEKMLYDNALLLFLYATTGFKEITKETAKWVIESMQSPEGGYYSSIDADSEGEEGKYYVWDKNEIELLLTKDEFEIVRYHYGLDLAPNFEKHWHLFVAQSLESVATLLKITLAKATTLLNSAKSKLLAARTKRVAPSIDKKILTSWNGLMIKAMLTLGYVLNEPRFQDSAAHALAFVRNTLWVNHRLVATYKDRKAHLSAYLDDYVFLIDALLTSLKFSWNKQHLLFAIELAEVLLKYFYDETSGACYFTASDHETLLYRLKILADEALPSGNGVFVRVMLTLGHLLGETRYLDAAENTLRAAWSSIQRYPAEHATLLLGLHEFLMPQSIVVIRGTESAMKPWQEYCLSSNKQVFAIPDDEQNLPGSLELRKPQGFVCAYVCRGVECQAVIEDFDRLKKSV